MDPSTKLRTDIDSFRLRELKYRGEGQGRTFKAPDGSIYNVAVGTIAGAPHVARVSIDRAARKGQPEASLGYEDVHFAPEQDFEAVIMKNIRNRLFAAADAIKAQAEAGKAIAGWGSPAPDAPAKSE